VAVPRAVRPVPAQDRWLPSCPAVPLRWGGVLPVTNLPERRPSTSITGNPHRRPLNLSELLVARQVNRALLQTSAETAVRVTRVQAEGTVQTAKTQEIDNLAREAMTGQAMLAKWRDLLAGADPLLHDELRTFSDMARLGKSEVIADTVQSYCRESRGQR
jgi:hypothetical protein